MQRRCPQVGPEGGVVEDDGGEDDHLAGEVGGGLPLQADGGEDVHAAGVGDAGLQQPVTVDIPGGHPS